ncbi:MAG: hemolysin XhlA family protein [Crocosphaera sp.]|nr:hemolysin XhlA family protein [Crocosphaera sp.]
MANTPIQLTTDLSEVLGQINQKLDNLQKDVTELKIGQTRLESDVSTLKEDVKELKGSTKAQIWTLIGILGTAVIGTIIRFVITAYPGNP